MITPNSLYTEIQYEHAYIKAFHSKEWKWYYIGYANDESECQLMIDRELYYFQNFGTVTNDIRARILTAELKFRALYKRSVSYTNPDDMARFITLIPATKL